MKRNQKIKFEDGSLYKGSTKNGVPNGVGELVNGMNLKYKGKWKDGNKSGRGELEIELNGIFCIGGDDPKDEKEPFKLFYMVTHLILFCFFNVSRHFKPTHTVDRLRICFWSFY